MESPKVQKVGHWLSKNAIPPLDFFGRGVSVSGTEEEGTCCGLRIFSRRFCFFLCGEKFEDLGKS